MDSTRLLYDTENNLRSYIGLVFSAEFGSEWYDVIKIPKVRLKKWEIGKISNELAQNALNGNEQLIQYAPFKDIIWLLKKKWNATYQQTFGDYEGFEAYLKIIEEYRDPERRRRELLTYQKHLILGVAGEINAKITRARSMFDLGKPGFPRINGIKDSFGNLWTPGKPKRVKTNMSLKIGEVLEFNISASDPEQKELFYRIQNSKWQNNNVIFHTITSKMLGTNQILNITIKNSMRNRAYPAGYDDRVSFEYDIFPEN